MNRTPKLSKIILLVIIAILAFLGAMKVSYDNIISRPNSNIDEKVLVEITEGES